MKETLKFWITVIMKKRTLDSDPINATIRWHPSLSKISLSDVSYLLKYMVLKMIVVVTNMGSINYIVKSESYDRTEALRLFYEAADEYDKASTLKEKQEATYRFLRQCFRAGLIFDEH